MSLFKSFSSFSENSRHYHKEHRFTKDLERIMLISALGYLVLYHIFQWYRFSLGKITFWISLVIIGYAMIRYIVIPIWKMIRKNRGY